jgi:soluble lytic murein transglycosylase-like protein
LEFANTESPAVFPSIAPAAAAIPSSKIDLAALDAQFLKSDKERHAVAMHLASKYRISMAESQRYVSHAIEVANEVNLDPVLLLAVMATESSFNPNAQSRAGAQGLMQVLTRVHTEKFEPYGGVVAAFVPEANIRVGALILKACIAKAGSLEAGLRSYLGAPNASSGPNSYTYKVIAEREELNEVARNRSARTSGQSNA